MTECGGSEFDVTRNEDGLATVKATQPVLVRKLKDEFDVPDGGRTKFLCVEMDLDS